MMKFLENYAEIKDKSDDNNDIKFNLGEIFI